jgi:hypothetical protein
MEGGWRRLVIERGFEFGELHGRCLNPGSRVSFLPERLSCKDAGRNSRRDVFVYKQTFEPPWKERAMKRAYAFGAILAILAPAALAQTVAQPKYPPGFNCSAVPAGSQRQACQDSQLTPRGNVNKEQLPAGGAVQSPGTVSPPTVPNQPTGENGNNGLGTTGPAIGGNSGTGQ